MDKSIRWTILAALVVFVAWFPMLTPNGLRPAFVVAFIHLGFAHY